MENIGSTYSQIISPSQYSHIMSKEHLYISEADQYIMTKIKEISQSSVEIIELGCGPGRLLSWVSEIEGINLTGVEPDPKFAKYARELIKKPNVQIIENSAEQYIHPKKVDIFYSQGMHHHITKGNSTRTYLKNIFNSLHDNGCYILSDEFLAHYTDIKEREKKVVIWHAHIIADALKNNFFYLAQEEAKTLLDDLFEGRATKYVKSKKQIDFVLSKVESLDQSIQDRNENSTNHLTQEFLEELETYHNLVYQGDKTIDLSRGDFKICESILRQELKEANLKIQTIKSIGPIETTGALSIYILRKG